ncbi:MAG: flippase-like domain-containing protein, partial [Hadesarchaea archaeon]|nr:flippase-like domain-containing protein [Hadesarchaea archaeon]
MLRALRRADYRLVLLALFTYVFSTVLWTIRWHISLLAVGCTVYLRDLYLVIYGSIFINNITPMTRAGGDPFGRVYLLQKIRGVPYSSSLATVMGEHALNVPVFFSFLALGLLMYLKAPLLLMMLVLIGIWVITAVMMLFFLRFFGRKMAMKWIGHLAIRVLKLLRKSKTNVIKSIEGFYKGAYRIIRQWKSAFLIIVLSAILWIFDMVRLFLIFKALGCSAPLVMLLLASTFPTIAGL